MPKGHLREDIASSVRQIEKWIDEGRSKAWMCEQFKCKPETLNKHLARLGIEYRGNQGGKGKTSPYRIGALDYAASSGTVSAHKLRIKLIEDGGKDAKCEGCRRVTWGGKPIPLELHHVDGDRFSNNLANLRILCPNCHALTHNHVGKRNGSRAKVAKR